MYLLIILFVAVVLLVIFFTDVNKRLNECGHRSLQYSEEIDRLRRHNMELIKDINNLNRINKIKSNHDKIISIRTL